MTRIVVTAMSAWGHVNPSAPLDPGLRLLAFTPSAGWSGHRVFPGAPVL